METRFLGRSGFKVPVLGFCAGTFGGKGPLFSAWGDTGVAQAQRMIDLCLEAGVNLFDTADVYSDGASEEILGQALQGRRDKVILSTKTGLRLGDGPNDAGASRFRLLRAVDASLRRLRTDYTVRARSVAAGIDHISVLVASAQIEKAVASRFDINRTAPTAGGLHQCIPRLLILQREVPIERADIAPGKVEHVQGP